MSIGASKFVLKKFWKLIFHDFFHLVSAPFNRVFYGGSKSIVKTNLLLVLPYFHKIEENAVFN